jgi:hypothetical protein
MQRPAVSPLPCCAKATAQFKEAVKRRLSELKMQEAGARDALNDQITKLQRQLDTAKQTKLADNKIITSNRIAYQRLQATYEKLLAQLEGKCFEREKICHFILPLCIQNQIHNCQKQWDLIYPTNKLTYGFSGSHAYGEPSLGTMARICYVIRSELQLQGRPLQAGDVLLDWGAGAGKWLLFARAFLHAPGMFALGVEVEEAIHRVCTQNINVAQDQGFSFNTEVIHSSSETFLSFCPARVVVNYDGGYQKRSHTPKSRIHQTIMRTAFVSPSVDVVVSTRLNQQQFRDYFEGHSHRLRGSNWKCRVLPGANFGGSSFNVNIWFRLTPMTIQESVIDSRFRLALSHFTQNMHVTGSPWTWSGTLLLSGAPSDAQGFASASMCCFPTIPTNK